MGKRLQFLAIIGIATGLLALKGAGPSVVFNGISLGTLEEAQATVYSGEASSNVLMDMNMLSVQGAGYGTLEKSLQTLQDSYLVPRTGVLTTMFDEEDDRTGIVEYEVQEGDVLGGIALDFGISLQTIISANNIGNIDAIKPGTVLKIPPVSGVLHTVKKGDTVASLAKKYGVDQDKIISFNGLPLAGDLQIGDELVVPGGTLPASVPTKAITGSKRFAGLPKFEGFFRTPASCRITQRAHIRNGFDCAAATGTPIYAAASGTVNLAKTGKNGGYGNLIRISHSNGLETLYGHLSKIAVITGETVQQGQVIGYIGSTGRSTGPHLHFEVHGAINPLSVYKLGAQVVAKQ